MSAKLGIYVDMTRDQIEWFDQKKAQLGCDNFKYTGRLKYINGILHQELNMHCGDLEKSIWEEVERVEM